MSAAVVEGLPVLGVLAYLRYLTIETSRGRGALICAFASGYGVAPCEVCQKWIDLCESSFQILSMILESFAAVVVGCVGMI